MKSFQRIANAAAVGKPFLIAVTHGDPHCYEETLLVRACQQSMYIPHHLDTYAFAFADMAVYSDLYGCVIPLA